MNKYFYNYHNHLIGYITLIADSDSIIEIKFGNIEFKDLVKQDTFIIRECVNQLEEYFNGKRTNFNIKINPIGTDFQKTVWNELINIPYGETRSYNDIALAIGNINSARAVGNANNANKIPIIIPCHRVINSNGFIGGYSGGVNIKKSLIDIERNIKFS